MATNTPEEMLQEARKLIGWETEPVPSRYPVEYDPIRRYCHMVGDDNPLFMDPEHAANARYGSVIAPPFFIRQTSGPGPWPPRSQEIPTASGRVLSPRDRNIVLNTEFELLKPVKVGDRISQTQRLVDVYIKPIRLDPKTFWLVNETIFRNQDDEVVATMRNTMVRHRTPEQVKAAGDAEA